MAKLESVFVKVVGLAASAALALACPLAATADQVPSYATGSGSESLHGSIASITGKFTLTLADDRGFTDSVTMHDGTVITPTGLSLETGQEVTVIGHTDGKTFDADEIDTDGSQPVDYGPNGGYYSSPYDTGAYPPYVIPLGNGGYYYGNGYGYGGYGGYGQYGGGGGYYYNQNQGSQSSGNSSGSKGSGTNTPVGGAHNPPIAHPPITRPRTPIVPRFYAPPSQRSAPTVSHPSSSTRSSNTPIRH